MQITTNKGQHDEHEQRVKSISPRHGVQAEGLPGTRFALPSGRLTLQHFVGDDLAMSHCVSTFVGDALAGGDPGSSAPPRDPDQRP